MYSIIKCEENVINGLTKNPNDNSKIENEVKKEVIILCSSFPIYKKLGR